MNTVNDKFNFIPSGCIKLSDNNIFDKKIKLVKDGLLKAIDYKALSVFFREKRNKFAAGEFWGKIMRASAVIYEYTGDPELLCRMRKAIFDMLSIQGEDGEISTAPKNEQPNGSCGADLWERKYVMLGMLGYYGITGDEKVKTALIKLLDYTISQVGETKTHILDTGWAFCGIESSSILEPVVKIYNLSGDKRHLDFASYIVGCGFCHRENVINAILSDKSPYKIGDNGDPKQSIAKAYEMMSCFEGLIEYYRVTGIEKYKTAALEFYNKLITEEITELGSGGADKPFNLGPGTGEQWNRTRYEQANPDIGLMMETCVTVTWMKLSLQLLRLEGSSIYADNIEKSAYNALCGALKRDGMFFEYFPKFNGTRDPKVNFSYNVAGFDLSCCTANGPMGLGIIPFTAFMLCGDSIVINFYVNGKVEYKDSTVEVYTDFPENGRVNIRLSNYKARSVLFKKAGYAKNYRICCTEKVKVSASNEYPGYFVIEGDFSFDCEIGITMEILDRAVISEGSINPYGNGKLLIKHGPVVLARDAGFTDITGPVKYAENPVLEKSDNKYGELLNFRFDGYDWIDYQSAGSDFEAKTEFVTWNGV